MKRKLCIVMCFICLLVAARWIRTSESGVISTMSGDSRQFADKKARPDHLYGKGIQRTVGNRELVQGTNLDILKEEEEKKYQKERTDHYISACISSMSLEEKLAQMMILTNRKDITKDNLETCQPGGILFFATDFDGKTTRKVKKRVEKLQSYVRIPLLIGVDEEGGEVSRIAGLKADDLPTYLSARELYKEGSADAVRKETVSKIRLLKSMGVNLNFNPVADIVSDRGAYMYERSAGDDAETVSGYVETVVAVMKENNMGSCLKHFPGYGNNGNTHLAYIKDGRKLSVYQTKDFLPFEAGMKQGADMVMVSHIVVTKIDKKNPASLSKKVHSILREDLNFQGVVIADDLKMKAILDQMTIEQASERAFAAGNDMIFSADFDASMRGAKSAVKNKKLSEQQIDESVTRILRMKINRQMILIE